MYAVLSPTVVTATTISSASTQASPYQRCFEVRRRRRAPGGREEAVERILLRLEHLLQVERRRVLRLSSSRVHGRVHRAEDVLSKEGVYGLNASLRERTEMFNVNITQGK